MLYMPTKKTKQKKKISEVKRDTNIAQLIMEHPEAAEVLLAFGLHCVGCFASAFDTIEEGAKIHGMPYEQINKMIYKLKNNNKK